MADEKQTSREDLIDWKIRMPYEGEIGLTTTDITSANALRVSIDVDASDAIRALKAIQREAREATKALRELEAEIADR